ncbi:hypothetical protein ACN9MJ_13655 [Acidovorax facilis]|uniref:hypothetical protein n=1 Tax=Acidovorax facilis TaxID=12917 RepID=UPI003CEFA74B
MNATHPTTERRTKPRTAHACQADRCRQGPCPVPQACELPEEEPYTNVEITGYVLVVAVAVVGACYLLFVGAGA